MKQSNQIVSKPVPQTAETYELLENPARKVLVSLEEMSAALDAATDRYIIARPALSVIIPVYNERDTIAQVIDAVLQLDIEKQVIVVDDGSTDGTREVLAYLEKTLPIEVFLHIENQGKGAALQTGFRLAEGDIVIVQDADLEYNPQDILKVIQPIRDGRTQVSFGSRYLETMHENSSTIHRFGNWCLTSLSNVMNGQRLTDMETCYKAFRRDLLQGISIEQKRFGFEPEITAKLARKRVSVVEVPITYRARSWDEGKKIGIKDLINALYCIIRYRWFR